MSEDKTTFASGAVRDTHVAGSKEAKFPARYDLITPIGLRRLAETCGEGAVKYKPHNWVAGMPMSTMMNHALAHLVSYLNGDRSEDHLAHCAWNVMGAMHFEETRPDLNDLLPPDFSRMVDTSAQDAVDRALERSLQ